MTDDIFNEYSSVNEQPQINNASNSLELTTNGVCKKFIHGKCQNKNCPNPHNKSKIKPCNNFKASGKCQYGDKCNFSHESRVCTYFMRGVCDKGKHCPCRHVYESCPNFDMGFCIMGDNCQNKHIPRKLCWDYMYGFCEKGTNRCNLYHPKIFQQPDFQFAKAVSNSMGRELMKYVCQWCSVIGHKVTTCPKRKEIEPDTKFWCGLCGNQHTYEEDCR